MRVPSAPAVTSPSGVVTRPQHHQLAMAPAVRELQIAMTERLGHEYAVRVGPGDSIVCENAPAVTEPAYKPAAVKAALPLAQAMKVAGPEFKVVFDTMAGSIVTERVA